MIRETERRTANGLLALAVMLLAHLIGVVMLIGPAKFLGITINVLAGFCWIGLFMVQPNQAKVLQLFGDYVGTVRTPGLRWANPFLSKKPVSLRIRNFDSDKLKVNDLHGSPIEIGAVIVWQVVDTAEAVFEVDDYEHFVKIQAESALRGLATRYPYDLDDDDRSSLALRSHADAVAQQLASDVQERLSKAGVHVIEARISHLAYAAEIAGAMLQRQQAAAIISARRRIVDGAVGMVEMALNELAQKQVVNLDEERRAAMVSNLLVVLCSDRAVTPVVNTGTLYS
ncbi:SPFH domain-containing protein [Sinimarinibacterium sp. CAU 1509]|nr:SPFH domain-containing protein [Sinimarinibacterium sp. CAU 1509]TJY62122.1 SPFH domain-containing protein [Sinimarinibacterium sp. CAU 1509]